MDDQRSEGRGLRERILNLKEQRISSGNSTWDDCEPIVYLLKRDVLAALDAEAAQQTPHAAGGELRPVLPTLQRVIESDLRNASDCVLRAEAQQKRMPFDHDNNNSLERYKKWRDETAEAMKVLAALAVQTSPAAGEGRIVAGQSDVALAHSAFAKGALNGMQGEPASRLGWPEQGASRIETQSVPREAAEHPQPAPEGRE